jgi:hypothetical protein
VASIPLALLGKNFLYGKSSPKRLKITNIVSGRSNERLDSMLMAIAAEPIKYAGTNQRVYQAHFSPFLYAVRAMAVIKKATPKSDKPPKLK